MDSSTPDANFLGYAKFKPLAEVKASITPGVDIHAREDDGDNAVHLAAYWNEDRSVVRFLLDLGIDAHLRGYGGALPLHAFAAKGDLEMVVRMLNEGDDVNSKCRGGDTPLHRAAAGGDAAVVAELIQRGADVHARDNTNKTPLHDAKSIEAIEVLVRAGADINAQSKWGDTPLHINAFWCYGDRCQKLIELGADLEVRANDGGTPLVRSVKNPDRKDNISSTVVLLGAGANWEAKDKRGSTIESLAKSRPALRQLLAAHKANAAILGVARGMTASTTKAWS